MQLKMEWLCDGIPVFVICMLFLLAGWFLSIQLATFAESFRLILCFLSNFCVCVCITKCQSNVNWDIFLGLQSPP